MTKEIANINSKPINKPKKKLIITVTFVAGFIISIFLVFLCSLLEI